MESKVYGTSRCSWSDRVAKILEVKEVTVEKIDISGSKELFKEMQEAVGQKVSTVPQVIIDNEYVGGFTEVERFLNRL